MEWCQGTPRCKDCTVTVDQKGINKLFKKCFLIMSKAFRETIIGKAKMSLSLKLFLNIYVQSNQNHNDVV